MNCNVDVVCISKSADLETLASYLRSVPARDRVIRHLYLMRAECDGSNDSIVSFVRDFALSSVVNMAIVTAANDPDDDVELIRSLCALTYTSLSSLTLSADFTFSDLDNFEQVHFPNVRSIHLDWRRGATWNGSRLSAIFPSLTHLGLVVSFFGTHITSLMNEVHRIRGAPPESQVHGPTALTIPDTVTKIFVEADPNPTPEFLDTNLAVCLLTAVSLRGVTPIRPFEYNGRSARSDLNTSYFHAIWMDRVNED